MVSEQEENKQIHTKRVLEQIKRTYGYDGVMLLCFHHTDEAPRIMTYTHRGNVPPMEEVLMAIGRLIAQTAYVVGETDAKNEFNKKSATNLDHDKIDPSLKL